MQAWRQRCSLAAYERVQLLVRLVTFSLAANPSIPSCAILSRCKPVFACSPASSDTDLTRESLA